MKTFFRLLTSLAISTSSFASDRPNILFIAIDDLNDWLGCYGGHPQAITPNIDRLSERGILFSNAHCAAPVCKSSRTAVFSGRYPLQTGVYGDKDPDIRKAHPDTTRNQVALNSKTFHTRPTDRAIDDILLVWSNQRCVSSLH